MKNRQRMFYDDLVSKVIRQRARLGGGHNKYGYSNAIANTAV